MILAVGEVGETGVSFLDGLPGVSDIGLSGVVILVVMLILRGQLVPRRHLDDAREDNAKLQATNDKLIEAISEIKEAVKDNVELARSADHLLREIQEHSARSRSTRKAQEATS